ncbi:hypothetical protein GALMADRAFT_820780 [Galerina marginata CBS 339.88]|uniref:Ubiquitin-like domain-containing protein n=1 Tax=Galerina marginata (strain CBS 339.88) TaxID=685588 RepID=A0A067TGR1_GALM3|nr:hypothetical protein GALMADRAFT_820780 [Galerina marginata CBS 339.88]
MDDLVDIYVVMIETGNFVPGGTYAANRLQDVATLKSEIASWYNLRNVTTQWSLSLASGRKLDNYQLLKIYGVNNGDTLYLQDPELVKISYSENNGPTKFVWAYRKDKIQAVKEKAFPGRANEYAFRFKGAAVNDSSDVKSLVTPAEDAVYLDLIFNARGG